MVANFGCRFVLDRSLFGPSALMLAVGFIASLLLSSAAHAVSPEQPALGQQLFTQLFAPTELTENGDGLGPLFNHTSCVACHHSGGVGGSGDHRFNARTFAISQIVFDQTKSAMPLTETLNAAAPGFVNADREVVNTFPLHRHGGSPEYDSLRRQTMDRFNPDWSDDVAISSDSFRGERVAHQIIDSTGSLSITGHITSRNTTALFGAGLIDQVPESVILQQYKEQQRHPTIHGRPATLADGRIGKFGWRANMASLFEFTENACVNELGLQTEQIPQAKDMTQTQYVNMGMDLDADSVTAMTAFIAALPTPIRLAADDYQNLQEINNGEQRFSAIGCTVCHVPTLGPAKWIYSDLLLHDMGLSSSDYNPAPPYRKNIVIEYEQFKTISVGYYGGSIRVISDFNPNRSNPRVFRFEAPQRPPRTVKEPVKFGREDVVVDQEGVMGTGLLADEVKRVFQRVSTADTIPTNFNQEWRTAPLWGLRDSAPYMHDGRAETVLEAIAMHDGEAQKTRNHFFALPFEDQQAILVFLDTFAAPQTGVIPVPKDFTRRHLAKD